MNKTSMSRSLRNRSLHDSTVTDAQVNSAVEGLLKGDPVAGIPSNLCQAVLTTLTQMRKDAILQRRDKLAAQIEIILGEMKYGPQKFQCDTPGNPVKTRERLLVTHPDFMDDSSS